MPPGFLLISRYLPTTISVVLLLYWLIVCIQHLRAIRLYNCSPSLCPCVPCGLAIFFLLPILFLFSHFSKTYSIFLLVLITIRVWAWACLEPSSVQILVVVANSCRSSYVFQFSFDHIFRCPVRALRPCLLSGAKLAPPSLVQSNLRWFLLVRPLWRGSFSWCVFCYMLTPTPPGWLSW